MTIVQIASDIEEAEGLTQVAGSFRTQQDAGCLNAPHVSTQLNLNFFHLKICSLQCTTNPCQEMQAQITDTKVMAKAFSSLCGIMPSLTPYPTPWPPAMAGALLHP